MPATAARLGALASNAAGQLDVLGHDGHTLGVDGTQVRVLEQTDQVRLRSLLSDTTSTNVSARERQRT